MANLSVKLSDFYLEQLRKEAADSYPTKTMTTIIQELVKDHYDKRNRLEPTRDEIEHVDGIKESLSEVIAAAHKKPEEETKGIVMPENIEKIKSRSDPEIQKAFSIMDEKRRRPDIRSGPGAIDRLRAAGVNPMDVLHAKRAKAKGGEYDQTLEKYFILLESNA
jgi:hypothetical protein